MSTESFRFLRYEKKKGEVYVLFWLSGFCVPEEVSFDHAACERLLDYLKAKSLPHKDVKGALENWPT